MSVSNKNSEALVRELLKNTFHDLVNYQFKMDNVYFQVDGYSKESNAYFEIYSGTAANKGCYTRKAMSDVMKLLTIEKLLGYSIDKYLVFVDPAVENQFRNNSWIAKTIELFDIHLITLNLKSEKSRFMSRVNSI